MCPILLGFAADLISAKSFEGYARDVCAPAEDASDAVIGRPERGRVGEAFIYA